MKMISQRFKERLQNKKKMKNPIKATKISVQERR